MTLRILPTGGVYLDGKHIGKITPTLIAGKQVWQAQTVDGKRVPQYGNQVRPTREKAAQMLAKAIQQ